MVLLSCSASQLPLDQPVGYVHVTNRANIDPERPDAESGAPADSAGGANATGEPSGPTAARKNQRRAGPLFLVCDLPNDRASGLHFTTDTYALRELDEQTLRQVAYCMRYGTLRGKQIVIYGYADPRGSRQENSHLAQLRAKTVQRYLVRMGVDPTRMRIATVGEKRARGVGPESWFYDRRVEIHLSGHEEATHPHGFPRP